MTKNKKKVIKVNDSLENEENESQDDLNIKHPKDSNFLLIQADDIEKAERITGKEKIKGLSKVERLANRKPKTAITKFDRKMFDAGFMSIHTREFTYKLLENELKKANLINDLVAEVNAGKEATIYIAHLNSAPIIVKAFRHQRTCHNSERETHRYELLQSLYGSSID